MGFAFVKIPQKDELNFIEGDVVAFQHAKVESLDINGFICSPWAEEHCIYGIQGEFSEIKLDLLEFSILKKIKDLGAFEFSSTPYNEFQTEVIEIQSAIKQEKIQKAVAARTVFINQPVNLDSLLNQFRQIILSYPNAMVTLFYSEQFGLWMGASPEILLLSENENVTIMSLAGTLTEENQTWSQKERLEQSITSEFISDILQKFHIDGNAYQGVQELNIGGLKHLRSDFKFKMALQNQWKLLNELNPTPAVCGFPQKNAKDIIGTLERFDRQLFTGFWGIKTKNALSLYVNLRCCQFFNNGIQYFAGCGINLGSEVEKEWIETEAKMGMIKRFLS